MKDDTWTINSLLLNGGQRNIGVLMESVDSVLTYWFGKIEETIIPSEERSRIWFSDSIEVDEEIKSKFLLTHEALSEYDYAEWQDTPRSRLAKIIVLDQFSRHLFRNTSQAYEMDKKALETCLQGIRQDDDHNLSLIERVFFYFPMMHSEQLVYQEQALIAYRVLSELAFDETKVIYDSFLKFANHHYTIIQRFGRFPQRNAILSRSSTKEERQYLLDLRNE